MRGSYIGKLLRGAVMVILGSIIMIYPIGCGKGQVKETPAEGERIVYNSDCFKVIQGEAVHKQVGSGGREYIFVPLTLKNISDSNIIFSSNICVKAHALPSGEICSASNSEAIAAARESIKNFILFDGIIYGNKDTDGWLVFEAPSDTEQICVDFYTGIGADDYISFSCKV